MENLAILTGDLISSTTRHASDVDAAMQTLAAGARDIAVWGGNKNHFTRARGDGWQLDVTPPHQALRAALYLTARLRAADLGLTSRIAIGLGPITTLGSGTLADGHGEAFVTSGQRLDAMRRGEILAVAGAGITPLHRALVVMMSERVSRWTREQAQALLAVLPPDALPQTAVAERLKISPQAVGYRLSGAAAAEFRTALQLWESVA